MKEKKQTDPMEEAYKMLDGEPAGDAVSKAAKGEEPESDFEAREDNEDKMVSRFQGKVGAEIEEAYAMLFESLSIIMRKGN